MSDLPTRKLGRSDLDVPAVWHRLPTSAEAQAVVLPRELKFTPPQPLTVSFLAVEIGADVLGRQGDPLLIEPLQAVGRQSCDLVIVQGVLSSDVKVGWPMHRLQQLRDRGLCRYFAIEVEDPLEAEWLAANTPVHGVVVPYSYRNMAVRYRVFDVAHTAGVAIITRAATRDQLAFALATPQITAVITDQDARELPPLGPDVVENAWEAYKAENTEPPKLRSAHPPETGA